MRTIDCLGGCQINKEYVCTVPVELNGDTTTLLEMAEEVIIFCMWSMDMLALRSCKLLKDGQLIDLIRRLMY